jgi:putative nucleotidyltransferase with HDIG domain
VARAFADFVDLKSIHTLGHSTAVAALAESAGEAMGLPGEERALLRRAALLHDIGMVSVPTVVWEKPGALSTVERERVRLHPYYTERVLSSTPLLAPIGAAAGSHHERADASGYPKGLPAGMIPRVGRVLAAADFYQALTEARAYRPAHAAADAAKLTAAEASAKRLDGDAVDAVLAAAGHRAKRTRGAWPAGLSDREVEVLRLVARGRSNKEVAGALDISAKTVQHHVMHIYCKIGVSTRAGAAVFAIEHDLLQA